MEFFRICFTEFFFLLTVSGLHMKPTSGLFISSFLAALLGTVAMVSLSSEASSSAVGSLVFVYTLVGTAFAVFSACVFGWPLSKLYQRIGFFKWWQYALGGAACALPFWVAWFYPFKTGHWEAYKISNTIYFIGVGVLSGFFYWYFVIRPQPTNK